MVEIMRRRMFHENQWLKPARRDRVGERRLSGVSKTSRRGAVTVELAIVSPLIFLFFFAAIEFGRLQMTLHGLEGAAREGCRVAVSWDASQEDVEQAVATQLAGFGVSGYTLTTDPGSITSATQWEPVNVRIEVPYEQVSWLPPPRFLQGITLRGSCTLPKESDPMGS